MLESQQLVINVVRMVLSQMKKKLPHRRRGVDPLSRLQHLRVETNFPLVVAATPTRERGPVSNLVRSGRQLR
jgi:hypothetical protein